MQTMRRILQKTSRKVIMKSLHSEKRYLKKWKREHVPKHVIITIEEYIGYQLLRYDDIPPDV